MLNDLPSQEILEMNPKDMRNGFETSRHNISEDQSLNINLDEKNSKRANSDRNAIKILENES